MKTLFWFFILSFSFSAFSQRGKTTYNRIGLEGQYASTTLNTTNFETLKGSGFLAGFSTRGAFYNDFDLIYGLDFMATSVAVYAENEEVNYNLSGVQLKFLLSYLLAGENLSIELGPALQVNGKLELNDLNQENLILDGYTSLQAGDIQEISRVNGVVMAGITGGFERVRLFARYQYNFNNILNRLNKEDLQLKDPAATNFKGNIGSVTAGIVLYL